MSGLRVVVCGGGIAGAEALLRLRRLAGDAVEVTLVAPNEDLVYRPLAVGEPFAYPPARRWPLARIAADTGAELVRDRLAAVDCEAREIGTAEGRTLRYDALLVAVGGRKVVPYDHVTLFDDAHAAEAFAGIVRDVEEGYTRSVALLLPPGPAWPLPAYELALMTARRAYEMGVDGLELALVTPEPRALAAFGEAVSATVERLLDEAGVTLWAGAMPNVPAPGRVLVHPQGIELEAGRIVAMPQVEGPAVPGLPGQGRLGFVPIDAHCVVPETGGRVFAAGDATAYPVKQGGLGAQMADVAAAGIARLAGADVPEQRLEPVLRGMLLTGREPVWFTARVEGERGFVSEVLDGPAWDPPEKVVAEELGPYLASLP